LQKANIFDRKIPNNMKMKNIFAQLFLALPGFSTRRARTELSMAGRVQCLELHKPIISPRDLDQQSLQPNR
jgi:hypothetical protein